jgi:hypothetical protein
MKMYRTGTKLRSEKVEIPQLPVVEWDFREVRVPESELLACALYEYAREAVRRSPKLQRLLDDLAGRCAAPKGTEERARQFNVHLEILEVLAGPLGMPFVWLDMCEMAWQSLPERTRKTAMSSARYIAPAGGAHFSPVLSLAQISEDLSLLDYATSVNATALVLHGSAEEIQCGFFSVNWSFPREKIESAFSEWLTARLAERPGYSPAHSQRGKGKADSPRGWLKALAATRLLGAGMTAAAAVEYTQRHGGAALFQDKAEWSKAKKQVAVRLQFLFPRLAE